MNLRLGIACALVAGSFVGTAAADPRDPRGLDWGRGLEAWQEYAPWSALGARARGAHMLARTGDARALPLLRRRYGNPLRRYAALERYLVATAVARFADSEEGRAEVEAWVKATGKRDPYFAYNAYLVIAGQGGTETVAQVALGKQSPLVRAAALEALGRRGEPARSVEVLAELLAQARIARRPDDRRLLIGACSSAVLALSKRAPKAALPAVEAMIQRLEQKRTPRRTEEVLNLHLARLFGVDLPADPTPDHWRALLGRAADAASAPKQAEDAPKESSPRLRTRTRTPATQTSFMGITTQGTRIVYLIDMSDSMLLPLSEEEKEALRQLLVDTTEEARAKQERKRRGPARTQERINWAEVTTRFDAVREFLKLSLRTLDPRASYTVIGFGSEAKCLSTTPALTPARDANRLATIEELDAIRPGRPTAHRKHGTLRGQTNLHAALRLAFQVTGRKPITTDEEQLELDEGAETVFLLSDGTPTTWNYGGTGPSHYQKGYEVEARKYKTTVRDPETGETREVEVDRPARRVPGRQVTPYAHGPYRELGHFRADLERLNLFRKATIHVVGVGEYSRTWLDPIVEVGLGKLQLVGEGSPEERARAERAGKKDGAGPKGLEKRLREPAPAGGEGGGQDSERAWQDAADFKRALLAEGRRTRRELEAAPDEAARERIQRESEERKRELKRRYREAVKKLGG